jgi:hypothetical protein
LEHHILPIKTKKISKKLCFVPKKWKGAKILYGGYPTEFAGSTLNPKKIIETSNQPIKTKISQKNMFNILKELGNQKFVWGLPDGIRAGES